MRSALPFVLVFATSLFAEAPLRLEWKAGAVHKYRVRHDTTISETASDMSSGTTTTKLSLVKVWTVSDVAADGSATLALSIAEFRQELTRPVAGKDGSVQETSILDSRTPEGAEATAAYLNKPILTAKVDTRGRISDVKGIVGDAANRLQAELPFRIELPAADEAKWERPFTIKLDPPAGTGEKFEAIQTVERDQLTFKISTSLKAPPKEVAELQPLLPWLWEGGVMFDAQGYAGAKLAIARDYANHQGAGTKFSFRSAFEETRLEK